MELQNILADVRRGIWRPPVAEVVQAPREIPTFHVFASEWFERQKVEGGRHGEGLAPKSREDLQWRLSNHLLPAFAARRLDQWARRFELAPARRFEVAPLRVGCCVC